MAELVNTLTWSVSRAETLEYCPRKYFLSYYEAWGGWNSDAAPRKKLAYFLKKRETSETWIGTVVHRAIRFSIQNIHTIDKEFVFQKLRERFDFDYNLSLRKEFLKKPKTFGLYEHYKGLHLDLQELSEKGVKLAEKFFSSSFFQDLERAVRNNKVVYLDSDNIREMQFQYGSQTVYAIPDVCFQKEDGEFVLIDWKTGKVREGEELTPQVKMYVLRLMIEKGVSLKDNAVTGFNYYLAEGSASGRKVTEEDIESVKNMITDSHKRMTELLINVKANIPKDETFFPKTTSVNKCKSCSFQEICETQQLF